jgi:hypothetical protein
MPLSPAFDATHKDAIDDLGKKIWNDDAKLWPLGGTYWVIPHLQRLHPRRKMEPCF